MKNDLPAANDAAYAESEALAAEAVEQKAEQRFKSARAGLEAAGRAQEVTSTTEFRTWIAARHDTDLAWGRWAMAMDAQAASVR